MRTSEGGCGRGGREGGGTGEDAVTEEGQVDLHDFERRVEGEGVLEPKRQKYHVQHLPGHGRLCELDLAGPGKAGRLRKGSGGGQGKAVKMQTTKEGQGKALEGQGKAVGQGIYPSDICFCRFLRFPPASSQRIMLPIGMLSVRVASFHSPQVVS